MYNQIYPMEKYPTLHKFAISDAKVKCVVGPAGCLPAETEVMTRDGWVRLDTMPEEALVYNPDDDTAAFSKVKPVVFDCPEGFNRFVNAATLDMVVSDEHRVWYKTKYDQKKFGKIEAPWHVVSGGELGQQWAGGTKRNAEIRTVFDYKSDTHYPLTDDQIRVCVMLSADGSLPDRGNKAIVTVWKERKKERIRYLLDKAGIAYTEHNYNGRPTETTFRFVPPEYSKDLSRFYKASRAQLEVIVDEVMYWDAHRGEKGSYYTSNVRSNIDFVQFAFCATGMPSKIMVETYDKPNWNPTYRATCSGKQAEWINMTTCRWERVPAVDGKKYCLETTTGMFIARHNGKVFATGNTGKTSFMAMEILRRACMQEPNHEGVRYTKVMVGRNTYQVLKSNTIDTFKRMWGNLAWFKTGAAPLRAGLYLSLGDDTKVQCDVEFISFDTPDSISKLLGYEPTMVFLDEISEMSEDIVLAAARRIGRYPSGVLGKCTWSGVMMATNGPRKNHWLYDWYLGKKDEEFKRTEKGSNRKFFEFFKQPAALLQNRDGAWVPNPRAENIDNLAEGYGYYFDMLGGKKADIQAYVQGDFADLVTGKLVFPEFNRDFHVVDESTLDLSGGFPMYLAFDFGRTPCCIVAVQMPSGAIVIIDEMYGEDMAVDTLARTEILPHLRRTYPKAWIEDGWGDPAGEQKTQAVELTPFEVLKDNGIYIKNPDPSNRLEPRIEAVKQYLTRTVEGGRPMLQVSSKCKLLIQALGSDYIYEMKRGANGVFMDKPTKSHVNWVSELADCTQYLCLGMSSMLGSRKKRSRFSNLPPLNTRLFK